MGNDNKEEANTIGGSILLWNAFMDFHKERYMYLRTKCMASYDCLEFPIRWDRKTPLLEHLFYIFKVYLDEVREYKKVDGKRPKIDEEKMGHQ